MIRFIVRRLLSSIPVLLGVVLLVFILARVIPGDPCRAALGERATDAVCNDFEARYGLDQPIPIQFGIYMAKLLTGDLGASIRFGRPVADILAERLPLTLELTLFALVFATFFGVLLGILSAIRRNSPVDVGTMIVANLGVSTPVFVLGLLLQIVFAVALRDTILSMPPSGRLAAGVSVVPLATSWGLKDLDGPLRGIIDFASNMYLFNTLVTGQWSAFWDAVRHLILPAVAVGTIPLAIIARMTRSSLLEVLGLDYIRTARAKGLRERLVVVRHGLRNAMLPVVTVIGLSLGAFLSGAVLTETIFNLAGVGRTIVEAITGRDYIVIQGVTIVIAIGYLLVNLIVDVSYAFLDPRIRLT
ncbi:MAG TPA: ABC transporter permease [Candidatus Limnocylindrales bacterium]|jgi:peptide/nickel transport system permease protein|nr:ABC transporter permease [Candidatus Limnocylindrales bacterium]